MIKQKAGVFGLDARITLIIFSTLGIVAFANIYSFVDKTIATQIVTDMKNFSQSYKNFKTDTHADLTDYTNPYFLNVSELVSLTKDEDKPYTLKYAGPYTDYTTTATNNFLYSDTLDTNVAIISRSFNNTWASQSKSAKCADTDCFLWVMFETISYKDAETLDKLIDGEASPTTGKIRLDVETAGSLYSVFYLLEKQ